MSDFEDIIQELQALADAAPMFKPRELKNKNNKWLIRSALQKAIRRGRTEEALRAAAYLMGTEPAYAWYTMSIIVVEDIGLGDPDLLSYSTITGLKTVTTKIDSPAKLYAAMVVRACETNKTRSCCELSFAEYANKELQTMMKTDSTLFLMDQLLGGPKYTMEQKFFAASELRRRCSVDGKELMTNILQVMMDQTENVAWARAAMMTFERFASTMNMSTYPLVQELSKSQPYYTDVVDDEFPPELEIMGFSSSALDMHVQAGKRAIKAFYTSLAKKHSLMADLGKVTGGEVVKALGAVLFVLEGGQEKGRLMNPFLKELKHYQDVALMVEYGVPVAMLEPIQQLVRENFDVLNEKRVWSIQQ